MLPAKLTVGTQDTCNVKRGSIGIARLFVLQLSKIEFNSMPYLYNSKKWTGWDLNPRPQHLLKMNHLSNGDQKRKDIQIPPAPLS